MKIISVLTALAAFKITAALPSSPETGVATYTRVDPADIPAAYKIGASKETDLAARRIDENITSGRFGIYICTEAEFKGICWHIVTNLVKQCSIIDHPLTANISSLGPDRGSKCRFFISTDCYEDDDCWYFDAVYPGISNLDKGTACGRGNRSDNFNNRIWSYWCDVA
ncbi:hypothetical protein QBC45DRAFT_396188 [Copromyces sp. CBS 386.78]|nr:hypothetical protein QBC45DRAFT_396188 [Copromyces sp. CBS 386.78]